MVDSDKSNAFELQTRQRKALLGEKVVYYEWNISK